MAVGLQQRGIQDSRHGSAMSIKQQSKEMRSASLPYVKRAVNVRCRHTRKINKHVENAKQAIASRYLHLNSSHAFIGVHLLRFGKVQDAQCWWFGSNK